MDRTLLKAFWNCGDSQIIEFAITRARLNKLEKEVIINYLDECMSQEQIAETMYISSRSVQKLWASGADKLLAIPWVSAYAKELLGK